MAALSALRNRNSQKMREGFESFLAKCVESSDNKSEVDLSYVVRTMEENSIKLEQKEIARLEKICDNNNKINRFRYLIDPLNLFIVLILKRRLCTICKVE